MPRAENRKRAPNFGHVPGGKLRSHSEEIQHGKEQTRVQSRKQDVLDKMRKLQESKKINATTED